MARAAGNRLHVANGARLWTHDVVRVGETNSRLTTCPADENIVTVAGGPLGEAFWDMGGAPLAIGATLGPHAPSRDNKLFLYPGANVVKVGRIAIGEGTGTTTDNAIVLAGGAISAKSLCMFKNNGIDVILPPSGLQPVRIEGDITVGDGAFVNPRALADAKGGRYQILGWGGNANDISKLRLHAKADGRKWKLETDETNKKVFLIFTP